MKKLLILILLPIILFCTSCSNRNNETKIDENEFVVLCVNKEDLTDSNKKNVLFSFNYTQEMYDYEIKHSSWTKNQGDLVIRCRINNSEELIMCNSVNAMYGIKYENDDVVLSHKVGESVYFYKELNIGKNVITFYLEYAAESPYKLIRQYTLEIDV